MSSPELQASSGLATIEWHGINWAACHRRVRSLQRRIVQAVQAGAWRKVKRLSYLLVHSFAARALAVKRVTDNHGKKTPGMDGTSFRTPLPAVTKTGTITSPRRSVTRWSMRRSSGRKRRRRGRKGRSGEGSLMLA